MAAALVLLLAAACPGEHLEAVRATRAEGQEKTQRQRAEQERSRAEQLRATAEEQAAQIGRQLYASQMNMGLNAWENGDLAAALTALERYLPQPERRTCVGSSGLSLATLPQRKTAPCTGIRSRFVPRPFSRTGSGC